MIRHSELPTSAICAGAWCGGLAAAVVAAPQLPLLGAGALVAGIAMLPLALALRKAWVLLALAMGLFGMARAELPGADPGDAARAAAVAGRAVTLTATVADDARPLGGGFEVLVEPAPPLEIGNVLLRVRSADQVAIGDIVQASGRLVLPREVPDFDRRAYLAQRHAFLELATNQLLVVNHAGGLRTVPGWIRDHYRAAIETILPPPHSAVLVGVVLGVRAGIPAGLNQALIATGLVHLLVLSGLKVAVFARLTTSVLAPLLGRAAPLPVMGLIGLYAVAGGATPAAVRAAAMGGVAILAGWLGRPSHVWTSLAWTGAAMLAWHPELAWDVGFQLSFAGTAAIVILTPPIERRLRWVPHRLREPFAVTCAAQVGTLPVMAQGFHVLSPVAPLANALTLPLLPAVVAAGLVLAPLAAVPDLGAVLVLPLTAALAYIEQVAELLARVPGAAIAIPSFPTWAGAAYYIAVGGILAGARRRGRARRYAWVLAGAIPVLITGAETAAWLAPPASAAILNIGDGEAVLLTGPSGRVLVGGGTSPGRLSAELGARLPPWQRSLSGLVIPDGGLGEVGGLAGIDYSAERVVLPEAPLPGTAWRTVAGAQVARGARIERFHAGQSFALAGLGFDVLAPEAGASAGDDAALPLAIRASRPGGRSICLLGALDQQAQEQVAQRLRGGCDYLLLPGGGRSQPAPGLLGATRQDVIVSTSGNTRLARGLPATIRRTDQEGTIVVEL
ncbi:MAG TPA: ComEC/Rec2 family competence protein [Candidatus Dormibacteraeota bacterium]